MHSRYQSSKMLASMVAPFRSSCVTPLDFSAFRLEAWRGLAGRDGRRRADGVGTERPLQIENGRG